MPTASSNYFFPFDRVRGIRRRPAPTHRRSRSMRYCQDWAMPIGTPIKAARSGIVFRIVDKYAKTIGNWKEAYKANRIYIRHEDGEESNYIHLLYRSVRVKLDRVVSAGEVIALSGQTGYCTYPHLHFGVYTKTGRNIPVKFKTGNCPFKTSAC